MDDLIKYLSSKLDFKIEEISLLKDTKHNFVYLLNLESGEKAILHKEKVNTDSGSSILNTYRTLKFLENNNINFVPRVIYFDPKKLVLIQTYVGDEDISINSMSDKELENLAICLAKLNSFTGEEFTEFCLKENLDMPLISTPLISVIFFGLERFEIVKFLCKDIELINWIKLKLYENISLSFDLEKKFEERFLVHGDIGNNIRISKSGKIYLIDFEFSRISSEKNLAYLKIHSFLSDNVYRKLNIYFSKYSNLNLAVLEDNNILAEKIIRMNDVIWAAMKWGEFKGTKNENKFKKLTYKRKKLYEDNIV